MTHIAAPAYIAPETGYGGRHQRRGVPAGMRVSAFTAREIAEIAREGVLWLRSGHVGGAPIFSRTRYVADADGALRFYSSTGARVSIAPADRVLHVLAR